jgi:adenylate cyclase
MELVTTGAAREVRDLVIVFLDLSTFTLDARGTDDARLAELVSSYYERVGRHASAAGGAVVKFIGDGALLVFPPDRADDALAALFAVKRDVDAWLIGEGWCSRLVVKVHCGTVIAGPFGGHGDGQDRFDIIGSEVNVAARLPTRHFAISPQAFRLLSPAGRQRFKKHTPPVTYIPVEDRHPT